MSKLDFIKKLYNGKNCYSDHMNEDELGFLHIPSGVEQLVSDMLDKHKLVFLTGNPGDGKTFIIKAIESCIARNDAFVETDFNKVTHYDDVARTIVDLYVEKRPAVFAINEYPFLLLCKEIKRINPDIHSEIMRAKKSAITYEISEPIKHIAVVDLNERNLLTNAAAYGGSNPPILLDAGADLESIKKASEQAYTLAKKTVEDFFINSIDVTLKEEIPSDTAEDCQRWIDSMVFSSVNREESIRKAVKSYYDSFIGEDGSPRLALSRALQIALYTFEYKNNSPSAFCRVLGVRCGLIGPRGNRANIKRYLINSFTLETVTLSALSKDDLEDGIELKELSEKLVSAYNILIGSDAETEYSILETYNIAQSTPGDLRGDLSINSQAIANTYISLGMGKRYADGVTLIGWRL